MAKQKQRLLNILKSLEKHNIGMIKKLEEIKRLADLAVTYEKMFLDPKKPHPFRSKEVLNVIKNETIESLKKEIEGL